MEQENFFSRIPRHVRSSAEKVHEDTGTEITYAHNTWSNRQILCDSLQNNLDAATRKFVSELEEEHIVDVEGCIERASKDPQWKKSYVDILNLLLVLASRAGDLEIEEKGNLIAEINQSAKFLDVKLRDFDIEHFSQSEHPELPELTYAVKDAETEKIIRGLSLEELCNSPYLDTEKFPLFEWRVQDSGSGFDVTKSVLYLPTKQGERFSRGVFGEGLKVNQAAIARTPGVSLRIHSQYEKEDGTPVAWVRRVRPESNMVVQKGKNVVHKVGESTGSGTTIRFVEYNDKNEELRQVLDPRTTPVESVASDFGDVNFKYPLGIRSDGVIHPGISFEGSAQFLQGLRIGSEESLLFSYDFQEREILAGRDRNHLRTNVMKDTVRQFWEQVSDPSMHRLLVERLLNGDSKRNVPERDYFFNACQRLLEGISTPQDEVLLQELVSILNLRSDQPNYVATQGDNLLSFVDKSKVHVVELKLSCSKEERWLLQGMLKNRLPELWFAEPVEISPNEKVREEKSETEKDKEFTQEELQFCEEIKELFSEVTAECEDINEVFESIRGWRPIDSELSFGRMGYSSHITFGITAKNGRRNITCYIPGDGSEPNILPDLSNMGDKTELKAKLHVLFMASKMLANGSFTSESRSYREYAQMHAQEILDRISSGESYDGPPLSNLYFEAQLQMNEQMKGMKFEEKDRETKETALAFMNEAQQLSCSPQRLLEIAQWCKSEKRYLISTVVDLLKIIQGRIIVEEGTAMFIKDEENEVSLQHVELSEEMVVGEWEGRKEYEVANDVFVIPLETSNHSLFKYDSNGMLAVCNNNSVYLNIKSNTVHSSEGFTNHLPVLDRNCLIWDSSISRFLRDRDQFSYMPSAQEREKNDLRVEEGVVRSPVTLEYISEHWSDPVRIFQDLGQNHMDAGGLEQRFLIEQDGQQKWVEEDDLEDFKIIGFELSDRGLGYSPNHIHTMGHTHKRNPFLTGKNGEGLKLAAASAKKNGFDITFASFGLDENENEVAWNAEAVIIDEEYTHEGKTNTAHRLAFDIKTQSKDTLSDRSSVTRVTLPANAEDQSAKSWEKWSEFIDPRQKDEFKNGGLNRVLITNEDSQGSYDEVGPVTALFERPGAIFENGTLVRTTPQDERTFTLGWNFPSITSTRERSHIDEEMARAYIQYYFNHTTDERAIEHLLSNIKEHKITEHDIEWRGDDFSQIVSVAEQDRVKTDVEPSWAIPFGSDFQSLPLFKKVASRLYPDKVLFSYEYAQKEVIPMGGSLRHIHESKRLNVSASDYAGLRKFFPTMESYLSDVRKSKVQLDSESLEPLREVMGKEIERVKQSFARLLNDHETGPILKHMLKKCDTTAEEVEIRLNQLHPEKSRGNINDVFVMSDESKADGVASHGIGLRVSLLSSMHSSSSVGRLLGVIDHEVAHKMLNITDYEDEFILLLRFLAEDKLKSRNERRNNYDQGAQQVA